MWKPILFIVIDCIVVFGFIGYRVYKERKELRERTLGLLWWNDLMLSGREGWVKADDDNRKKLEKDDS